MKAEDIVEGNKLKLSNKQAEIIWLMQNDWIMLIGASETNGRQYYQVTKGLERIHFNSTVFMNLLEKGLIYQQQKHPFDYVLTKLAESIELIPKNLKH